MFLATHPSLCPSGVSLPVCLFSKLSPRRRTAPSLSSRCRSGGRFTREHSVRIERKQSRLDSVPCLVSSGEPHLDPSCQHIWILATNSVVEGGGSRTYFDSRLCCLQRLGKQQSRKEEEKLFSENLSKMDDFQIYVLECSQFGKCQMYQNGKTFVRTRIQINCKVKSGLGRATCCLR